MVFILCLWFYIYGFYFTIRTYGVKQEFRFDEGVWLHRKSGQIRFFLSRKIPFFTSCVRNVLWATILYKNHVNYRLCISWQYGCTYQTLLNVCMSVIKFYVLPVSLLLTLRSVSYSISFFLHLCAVYRQFLLVLLLFNQIKKSNQK